MGRVGEPGGVIGMMNAIWEERELKVND